MTRKKTPAKRPAKKTPAKAPAQPKTPAKEPAKPTDPTAGLVRPLAPNALKLVLNIIDSAPMTGSDAQMVIGLKIELGRVAGVQQSGQ
jgi:hypothetical protein